MGLKLKDWERQGEKTTTIKRDAVQIKAETELFAKKENVKKRVNGGVSSAGEREPPYGWNWDWYPSFLSLFLSL